MILKKTDMKEMPKSCAFCQDYIICYLHEHEKRIEQRNKDCPLIDLDPLKIRYVAERAYNGEIIKGQSIIRLKKNGKEKIHLIQSGKEIQTNENYFNGQLLGINSIHIHEIKPETLKIVLDGE